MGQKCYKSAHQLSKTPNYHTHTFRTSALLEKTHPQRHVSQELSRTATKTLKMQFQNVVAFLALAFAAFSAAAPVADPLAEIGM